MELVLYADAFYLIYSKHLLQNSVVLYGRFFAHNMFAKVSKCAWNWQKKNYFFYKDVQTKSDVDVSKAFHKYGFVNTDESRIWF